MFNTISFSFFVFPLIGGIVGIYSIVKNKWFLIIVSFLFYFFPFLYYLIGTPLYRTSASLIIFFVTVIIALCFQKKTLAWIFFSIPFLFYCFIVVKHAVLPLVQK